MEQNDTYALLMKTKDQYGLTYDAVMNLFIDSRLYLRKFEDVRVLELKFNQYLKSIDLKNLAYLYFFEGTMNLTKRMDTICEQLVEMIADKRDMSKIDAAVFFYKSSYYKELSDMNTMLWIKSNEQIYDIFFGFNKTKYIRKYGKKVKNDQ